MSLDIDHCTFKTDVYSEHTMDISTASLWMSNYIDIAIFETRWIHYLWNTRHRWSRHLWFWNHRRIRHLWSVYIHRQVCHFEYTIYIILKSATFESSLNLFRKNIQFWILKLLSFLITQNSRGPVFRTLRQGSASSIPDLMSPWETVQSHQPNIFKSIFMESNLYNSTIFDSSIFNCPAVNNIFGNLWVHPGWVVIRRAFLEMHPKAAHFNSI